MLLLDEHSPRIPAAKRRLMVWPLQPRSSTEAFCLKSSHVHICSTPVFKRALLSSEHVGRRIETSLRRKRVRDGGSRRACGARASGVEDRDEPAAQSRPGWSPETSLRRASVPAAQERERRVHGRAGLTRNA